MIFLNAPQAASRMAGMVGFCFMTTIKACQGTGLSGWERAKVCIWGGGYKLGEGGLPTIEGGGAPYREVEYHKERWSTIRRE